MKVKETRTPLEEALIDPSKYFAEPRDVLHASGFTLSQKTEILKRWRHDAMQLMKASDESMDEGEVPHLAEVERALAAVREMQT